MRHPCWPLEALLVLLVTSTLLATATKLPRRSEETNTEEKCPYNDGSITCHGDDSTCCSTGIHNHNIPACINPATTQCCLYSQENASLACALNETCCGPSDCCSSTQNCHPALSVPNRCLDRCDSQNRCDEGKDPAATTTPAKQMECCASPYPNASVCYDPSHAQCCTTQHAPFVCDSEATCCSAGSSFQNLCCASGLSCCSTPHDSLHPNAWCYDSGREQCCFTELSVPYACSVAEVCCSGTCCPEGSSCCPSGINGAAPACCGPNQTCCGSGNAVDPVCCDADQECQLVPTPQCVVKSQSQRL